MAESAFPIRMRVTQQGSSLLVKALIQHPMHSGIARDAEGNVPAAHYITEVVLRINGAIRARADLGPGVSANPLFGWRLKPVAPGSEIKVSWRDNRGFEGSSAATVS